MKRLKKNFAGTVKEIDIFAGGQEASFLRILDYYDEFLGFIDYYDEFLRFLDYYDDFSWIS